MTNNIGKLLKEARKLNKLTQEELANKVGKKRSYIARIESEDGSNIKFKTLKEVVEKGFGQKIKIEFVNNENINK
ncbi:MAG: helix-turn-helix transcriptional regulator [Flavobacterium sp.]|nr:helix-turn-helix transcriptional regulator [Flavobacterium sp.]